MFRFVKPIGTKANWLIDGKPTDFYELLMRGWHATLCGDCGGFFGEREAIDNLRREGHVVTRSKQ